jgi:mannose-1-phosphate guanylyltransferase
VVISINGNRKRWAIILAGGEGKRLSSLTRSICGDATPKQFCPVIGNTSLFEQTRHRISLAIENGHHLAVVTRAHEPCYTRLLADMPARDLVIQPQNRGTAPAILYALLRLSIVEPDALVALFPCDHYVSDDVRWMGHVDMAFRAIDSRSGLIVLLGVTPESPETEYGWIEPGGALTGAPASTFAVRRFWEKPSADLAQGLWQGGCLWNSFVIVAQLSSLLRLIMATLPQLYASFARVRSAFATIYETRTVERLYACLDSTSFSRDVLAKRTGNLAVLPVRGVEWSDLGRPERVIDVLARLRNQHRSNAA